MNNQLSLIRNKLNQAFLFLQVNEKDFDVFDIYMQFKGTPIKKECGLSFLNKDRIKFQIFDLTGRIINESYLEENQIDFSNIPNGIYIVKLSSNSKSATKSVIKK